MVEFTKLNGSSILINPFQIEYVELIPDSKIIMMNGRFHIVKEGKEEIIERITQYRKEICRMADLEV
ncbi:flagellar FlbD family protein [Mediterraneibacter sp. NSJ-55]|uniref:Flagellar FlbD family protein n=1 Tax=Mediterraneibacter hominis TaxID=2763054 RepID=A0A923RSH9_9FIRM|nr:flagellar FlbD family protein [Mediterraneibacter hominis]